MNMPWHLPIPLGLPKPEQKTPEVRLGCPFDHCRLCYRCTCFTCNVSLLCRGVGSNTARLVQASHEAVGNGRAPEAQSPAPVAASAPPLPSSLLPHPPPQPPAPSQAPLLTPSQLVQASKAVLPRSTSGVSVSTSKQHECSPSQRDVCIAPLTLEAYTAVHKHDVKVDRLCKDSHSFSRGVLHAC